MSLIDLATGLELIKANGDKSDFVGPQPERRTALAEATLELLFPRTYREFLLKLGAGDIAGLEFYGVLHDDFENSGIPDAVWVTLKRRRKSGAPSAYIFVSDTGDGGEYAIDTSQVNDAGDSPVVEWWAGAPANAEENGRIVAEDFVAFLLQEVQECL